MFMALRAKDERAADLQALAGTLVETARRGIAKEHDADPIEEEDNGGEDIEQQLATVRVWASSLDQTKFQVCETSDGLYVQAVPSAEVIEALQHGNEELERATEQIRLTARYFIKPNKAYVEVIDPNELMADLASARKLLENPPSLSAHAPFDMPALVASATLNACLLHNVDIPDEALAFAVDTLLRVSEGEASPWPYEFEETYFEEDADRSAARVLPLLLMPAATHLRALVDGGDGSTTFKRVSAACLKIAQSVANEVRLHLARGLGHLWATPCLRGGSCHHQEGWQIATQTMRDCAVGAWNPNTGSRSVVVLDEPLADSLPNTADDSILTYRLDASIRALAPASTANICVSTPARNLLDAHLAAQRRSLLHQNHNNMDQRGTHSLVSARALLTLAQDGDDTTILDQINAYAGHPALPGYLLNALSAAAEETPDRAATARRIWPSVVRYVLDLHNREHVKFREDFYGDIALAAIIPNAAYEAEYLYQEIQEKPIVWWDPFSMRSEVEAWLATAAGKARCLDRLVGFLKLLSLEDQARVGLPWMSTLVLTSPSRIARGSFMLTT